jgi:hypothetical protein
MIGSPHRPINEKGLRPRGASQRPRPRRIGFVRVCFRLAILISGPKTRKLALFGASDLRAWLVTCGPWPVAVAWCSYAGLCDPSAQPVLSGVEGLKTVSVKSVDRDGYPSGLSLRLASCLYNRRRPRVRCSVIRGIFAVTRSQRLRLHRSRYGLRFTRSKQQQWNHRYLPSPSGGRSLRRR